VPYNITIVVKNVQDIKRISNMISELVENATGQKVNIYLHDKTKLFAKRKDEIETINRKLLK